MRRSSLSGRRAELQVLCLVPYPALGPSNRLRIEQYAPLLRTQGIYLTVAPYLDDRAFAILYRPGHTVTKVFGVARGALRRMTDIRRARRFDLVVIHRESAPIGPPLVERALRRMSIPYVYDFDDAIFLRAIHPSNRAWAWLRRPNVTETTRGAKHVIAGNEYLAQWARRLNERVTVLPTPVDTDRHRPAEAHARGGAPVIGWVGSSTTAPYLRIIDEPLRRLAERHEFVVRVIGGEYDHPTAQVKRIPYSLADEPAQVQGFDIGVLPEPDDEWTRGKGAFKGMLYMAAAVPVVASTVGVNPEVIGDGGLCVAGDDEWTAALERLLLDAAERRRLGAAGRRRIVERYSLHVQAPRFAAVLRDAIS